MDTAKHHSLPHTKTRPSSNHCQLFQSSCHPPEVTSHTSDQSSLLSSSPPLSSPLLHFLSPTPLFFSPPPLLTSVGHKEIIPPSLLHPVDEATVASISCTPPFLLEEVVIESSQPLQWCTFASITHDVAEIISCKITLGIKFNTSTHVHGTMEGRDGR